MVLCFPTTKNGRLTRCLSDLAPQRSQRACFLVSSFHYSTTMESCRRRRDEKLFFFKHRKFMPPHPSPNEEVRYWIQCSPPRLLALGLSTLQSTFYRKTNNPFLRPLYMVYMDLTVLFSADSKSDLGYPLHLSRLVKTQRKMIHPGEIQT